MITHEKLVDWTHNIVKLVKDIEEKQRGFGHRIENLEKVFHSPIDRILRKKEKAMDLEEDKFCKWVKELENAGLLAYDRLNNLQIIADRLKNGITETYPTEEAIKFIKSRLALTNVTTQMMNARQAQMQKIEDRLAHLEKQGNETTIALSRAKLI